MRCFTAATASVPTSGFTAEQDNTAQLKTIRCLRGRKRTRNHQQYIQWDGERFRKWAEKIGENTASVVSAILSGYKVEQQGYKFCMGLLKLSDKYTPERLENACRKALTFTPRLSLKNTQAILSSGQDKMTEAANEKSSGESKYGFTRGAEYYGGEK